VLSFAIYGALPADTQNSVETEAAA
jgi:hypothetical protein